MLVSLHHPSAEVAPALLPVDLAAVDAGQLVYTLRPPGPGQPPAQLLVDCGALPYQRTLGVCFLVSQLLVLHQSGARVWLRNVSPVLRHCLQLLQLNAFFCSTE